MIELTKANIRFFFTNSLGQYQSQNICDSLNGRPSRQGLQALTPIYLDSATGMTFFNLGHALLCDSPVPKKRLKAIHRVHHLLAEHANRRRIGFMLQTECRFVQHTHDVGAVWMVEHEDARHQSYYWQGGLICT